MMNIKNWKYIVVLLAGSAILFVSMRAERAKAGEGGCPECTSVTSQQQSLTMVNGETLHQTIMYSPAWMVCSGSTASTSCPLSTTHTLIDSWVKGHKQVQNFRSVNQCYTGEYCN